MILLILIPTFYAVSLVAGVIRAFGPTNVLIRHLRAQLPRWRHVGIYFVLGVVFYTPLVLVTRSGDMDEASWLTFLLILLWYDALKFWWHAVLTAIRCLAWTVRRLVHRRIDRYCRDAAS